MTDEKQPFLVRHRNQLITTLIVIAIAWILGQWLVPALLKAAFL